jgi:hypothetical protein
LLDPVLWVKYMAIDNPLEAFEQQYMREEPDLPNKLAQLFGETGGKLAFPDGGLTLEVFMKLGRVLFDRSSTEERLTQMWNLLRKELEHLEKTKASIDDVVRGMQLATWYDNHERDDRKRIAWRRRSKLRLLFAQTLTVPNRSVWLDRVLWVDAFVLDLKKLVQLLNKLIEDFRVLFGLDSLAQFVHLLSFFRAHLAAPRNN